MIGRNDPFGSKLLSSEKERMANDVGKNAKVE